MKIKIRNELDIDKAINLRQLSPVMKIYAGVITMWHNTEMYKNTLNKHLEEENIKLMQQDDNLKSLLLAQIYSELISNKSLSAKDKKCHAVVLSIDAKDRYSLKRVLKHKDFLPYHVEFVEECSDIRKAFKDMPLLIRVSKKVIEED